MTFFYQVSLFSDGTCGYCSNTLTEGAYRHNEQCLPVCSICVEKMNDIAKCLLCKDSLKAQSPMLLQVKKMVIGAPVFCVSLFFGLTASYILYCGYKNIVND